MKRMFGRVRMPRPAMILGVIAIVLALGGTAIAAKQLRLAQFNDSSRDRLAGTGVIQYAASAHTTPGTTATPNTVHTFTVQCELSKKATAGGFKWTGPTPPEAGSFEFLDAYPNGSGFVVRLQLRPDDNDPATPQGTALNQPISVYTNCVKSRAQRGTPPS